MCSLLIHSLTPVATWLSIFAIFFENMSDIDALAALHGHKRRALSSLSTNFSSPPPSPSKPPPKRPRLGPSVSVSEAQTIGFWREDLPFGSLGDEEFLEVVRLHVKEKASAIKEAVLAWQKRSR